jgi:NADH-quinone oxidoreductase subunit E
MSAPQHPARLSEASLRRIEELKKRYPHPQSVVLEALWMWQGEHGWISEEGMRYIAGILEIPENHVYGVVSFYTMFNRKPVGRHKIEVCTNVSCMLRNSERILRHIEERLQIKVGETTPDQRFTLVEAECLGSCGTAPVMQIGDRYYENLDTEGVDKVLKELR